MDARDTIEAEDWEEILARQLDFLAITLRDAKCTEQAKLIEMRRIERLLGHMTSFGEKAEKATE